jgi:adenylate kinase
MLAAPGAGKGTQGGLIAEHFGVPHIATGDLLRDHVSRETDLGQQVRRFLDKGDLVSDGIVLDIVRGALEAAKEDSGGYVLDGLPRTMEQARAVYRMTVDGTRAGGSWCRWRGTGQSRTSRVKFW